MFARRWRLRSAIDDASWQRDNARAVYLLEREQAKVTIRLLAKNGALGIGVLQDDGETLFVPLKRTRTQRQKDKAAYRFYNQYAMPQGYATQEITVRLHNTAEEEAKRLNRAENLGAIPPADPDFDRLYARRGDAESLNRNLEDSLYLKKAHSLGHLRQEADLLGFAQLVNSITLARQSGSA